MGVTQEDVCLYGENAAEWLRRWDAGESVWSVEMGGLGPGYEQCIQMQTAECLREMIAGEYDHTKWCEGGTWKEDRDAIDKAIRDRGGLIDGLSGAQWGAAISLASCIYMRWPDCIREEEVRDRRIQVSKSFPRFKADTVESP